MSRVQSRSIRMPFVSATASARARACAIAASLVAAFAPAAAAQVVRGVVVDDASGAAIPGAVVVLLDSAGRRLAGVLTDEAGRYALRTVAAGRYGLRAERIGFRSPAPIALTLGAGETVEVRLATRPIPVTLSAVQVSARTACVLRANDGREVSAVWEEARKALYATELTQAQELFSARLSRFERVRDATSGRVTSHQTSERSGVTRNPFVSLPAAQLSKHGYVRTEGTDAIYYGPDAAVLLSDEFLGDHCFRVERGTGGRRGLVGLTFEPVRERTLPDIRGTLWLDARSAELRDLEYTYTNVPGLPSDARHDDFGGYIRFRRMSSGAWIVQQWVIRMPLVGEQGARRAEALVPGMTPGRADRLTVIALREEGGEVMETLARGVRQTTASARAALSGVAYDSTRGAPLPDARVFLDGTQYAATTSADGRFRIDEIPPGTYALSVIHPRFDTLGVRAPSADVVLTGGEESSAQLATPSFETVLDHHCPAEVREGRSTLLRGVVVDAEAGRPAVGAAVALTWAGLDPNADRRRAVLEQRMTVNTDSSGRYVVCGAPEGSVLTLRATLDGRRGAPVRIRLPERDVGVLDLSVGGTVHVAAAAEPAPVPTTSDAPEAPVTTPATERERALAGFETRRRGGSGMFLTRAQIEARRASRFTDLLRSLPGVVVRPDPESHNGTIVELRGTFRTGAPSLPQRQDSTRAPGDGQTDPGSRSLNAEKSCPAAFWLDGLRFDNNSGIDFDIRPDEVEAVEVYPGGHIPGEFMGRANPCGLVIIWSRR